MPRAAARLGPLLGALVAALAAAPVRAEPPGAGVAARAEVRVGDHSRFHLGGEATGVYGHVGAIPITVEDPSVADRVPAEDFGYARLRLSPAWTYAPGAGPFRAYRVALDLDVVRHLVAVGDGRAALVEDPAGRREAGRLGVWLQEAYAEAAGPAVALRIGLMRSHWGLGVLANGGEDPRFAEQRGADAAAGPTVEAGASPFGWAWRGDRVARLQLAFFPVEGAGGAPPRLTLAVAADAVVDDDTADWAAGDRAYQGIAAVRGRAGGFEGGLYAVYRRQRHGEGGVTDVVAFDLHARVAIARSADLHAWLEAEVAAIIGQSTVTASATQPGAYDVASAGGLIRFGAHAGAFTGVLEVGYASGDDNPFDGQIRAFSFDREHRVGLLMFREAVRTWSAATAYNLADPDYRGAAPRGHDAVATGGAVRGASYVNPRIVIEAARGFHVMLGFLYARTVGHYADAWRSGLEGGVALGPNGAPLANELGWELDAGVRYAHRFGALTAHARLQAAYYAPGRAVGYLDRGLDGIAGVWLDMGVIW